jgi:DNA invertase Pin-like site-specific DNA recombinase
MRAVIYARYSSENQRDASIEDQVRTCKAEIGRRAYALTQTYADHAISGSTNLRPGYQKLLEDARIGQFDVVVAEALDRLSRDQESIAGLYKALTFAGVKLVTVSEGDINELHVGLKGTMNALFLKDLAIKTRRGLEGRVRQGKSAGGLPYGYEVVRQFAADGQPIGGLRRIKRSEANVVQRAFKLFASGKSPKAIATLFNNDKIPAPSGGLWAETTIRGHAKRHCGVLRNDIYRGKLIWNRQRFVKDPVSGKRLPRANPESQWVTQDVPELRIVSDDLWDKVQARFRDVRNMPNVRASMATKFWEQRRPRHILSGLVKCGCCDGTYAGVGKDYLACSTARRFGTCENRAGVRRHDLEVAVLGALKDNLLQPDLVEEFIRGYHEEINRKAAAAGATMAASQRRLAKVKKDIDAIIDNLIAGYRNETMKRRLDQLEDERIELERKLAEPPPTTIRVHPNLAKLYREKVENLAKSLADDEIRDASAEILRSLIDAVIVTPKGSGHEVLVKGEIGRLVRFANPKMQQNQCSVKVVAGAGNQRFLQLAEAWL